MMKLFVLILFLHLSSLVFSQDQARLLRKAYSQKSDTLFNEFLKRWQGDQMPVNIQSLNGTLTVVNSIMGEIYSNKERQPEFKKKYTLIDTRNLSIDIAKEDKAAKDLINEIIDVYESLDLNKTKRSITNYLEESFRWDTVKSIDLINFNPNYSDDKILYLDSHYNQILWDFLKRYGKFKSREEFLRQKINYIFHDGRTFSTFESINKITIFESNRMAMVDWSTGYCKGRKVYILVNRKWCLFSDISNICE